MKKLIVLLFIPLLVLSQDYNHIYNDVKKIPNQKYTSLEELHNNIIKPYYTDSEKVYAFAKFITDKISYGKRAKTPLNCINSGEGVCQDYSELFVELCKISGIENNFVTGMGVTGSEHLGLYDSNHAWNIVKLDGKYLIFDLTWASGYGSGDSFRREFNPKYFNPKPEDFIRDHFPDDSKWQLLNKPISKKEYINSPIYDQEFKNLSLKSAVVKNSKVEISFNSNADFTSAILFKWSIGEYGSSSGKHIDLSKENNFYKIILEEKDSGAYRYQLTFKNRNCTDRDKDGVPDLTYSCPEIMFYLVTPNYIVPKPILYDKKNPWGLIEAYHYIFYKQDFDFFKKLNPSTNLKSLSEIKYSKSLNESLSGWYGNYKKYYTEMSNGEIYYKIDNFKIVLSPNKDGYNFKELVRETLRLGKSGYGVKELQNIIGLDETGDFDEILEKKIKIFQKKNGLKSDGIVGKITYRALGM